jgi:hypothetical protein
VKGECVKSEGKTAVTLSPVTGGEGWGEGAHYLPFTLHGN